MKIEHLFPYFDYVFILVLHHKPVIKILTVKKEYVNLVPIHNIFSIFIELKKRRKKYIII